MPTVAAGSTASYTLPSQQQITLTFDQGERAEWEVRRSGTLVASGSATTTRTIGPFNAGDVLSITASRGAVDYAAASYSSAPWDGILALDTGVTVGAASTAEQILWQMELPAGQLLLPGYLSVAWLVSKSGATNAATAVRLRIGTTGTVSDAQVVTESGVVAGTRQRGYEHIGRASSATTYRLRHNGVAGLGQILSTSSPYPTEVTIPDASGALWLSLSVEMAGTTDIASIHDVIVRRIGG